jgi:hypothetical protein
VPIEHLTERMMHFHWTGGAPIRTRVGFAGAPPFAPVGEGWVFWVLRTAQYPNPSNHLAEPVNR